jgi:hypothetical protein
MIALGPSAIAPRKPKTAGVVAHKLPLADCLPLDDIKGNQAKNPRQNARIEGAFGLGIMVIRREGPNKDVARSVDSSVSESSSAPGPA